MFFSDEKNVAFMGRLFLLCKEKRIPVSELEKIVVSGASRYSGIIAYDFPSICALADFFDVSLDYLVGRSDVKEKR